MDKEQIKISFIELLYAVAIGASFAIIPMNPLKNIFGFMVFLFSILFSAYDWYQYHDSLDEIKNGKSFLNFFSTIITTMLLFLMLVHSFDPSLIWWLVFYGLINVIDIGWNLSTKLDKKWLYIGTSFMQCLIIFLFASLLKVKIVENNYALFIVIVIVFCFMWIFEKRIDKS